MKTTPSLIIFILAFSGVWLLPEHAFAATVDKVSLAKIKMQYDGNDRLAAVLGPGDRKSVLRYNERGQLVSVKNKEGEERYEYDRRGFLKSVNDHTGTMQIHTDGSGRLKSMLYPDGDEVNYQYNDAGKIAAVTWGDKHSLRFVRDLFGNPVVIETPAGRFEFLYDYNQRTLQRTYPNGAFSQFSFNREGRPTIIQHASPDHRVFLEFRYEYDDTGRLEKASELGSTGKLDIHYTYDAYDQLLKAEYSDGRMYAYTYDLFGNIQTITGPGLATTMSYNDIDQLLSLNQQPVKHDAAGNVTALGGPAFDYDSANSLISDGTRRFQYNALGLRMEASDAEGATRYVHFIDDLPYVLAEKGKTTKRYLWSDRQILGQVEEDDRALFFFEDHLGSVRAAMDNDGVVVGYADFDPFGAAIKQIPGVRFGFAGEEQDEDGKVYLRARYYEPRIGRFLSKEPVIHSQFDQSKLNRYSYAANSPINYRDRDGERKEANRFLEILQQVEDAPDRFLRPVFQKLVGIAPDESNVKNIWEAPSWKSRFQDNREYLIKAYDIYYEKYRYQLYPQQNNTFLSQEKVINIQKHAFREMSKDHSGNPFSPGKRFGNIRNMVVDSIKGEINVDWLFTLSDVNSPLFSLTEMLPHWQEYDALKAVQPYVNYYFEKKAWLIMRQEDYKSGSFLDKYPLSNWNAAALSRRLWDGTMNMREALYGDSGKDSLEINPTSNNNFSAENASPQSHLKQKSDAIRGHMISTINTAQRIFSKYDITCSTGCVAGPGGYASLGGKTALSIYNQITDSNTPNVGGVYLDKAAEAIGQIANIEGATFDPESNRLILIGSDAAKSSLPPTRLDDLAAAFHSVFGSSTGEPGVTIDPNPENPLAEKMNVRFFGGVENTHFGYSLFEADRVMKSLSLGQDNITHNPVGIKAEGYYNMLDLGFSNLGRTYKNDLWSRFWLVPERVVVKLSEDKKSITFPDTRIRVKTETMRWQNGKLVPAGEQKDDKAEYFAAHFTRFYDQYAKEFPVFQELKNLANLVGLAKWLKASGLPVDLGWLDRYLKPYETPTQTPSHTVSDERRIGTTEIRQISVFGGTDLTVENVYVKDDGTSSDSAKKAIRAVAGAPGVAVGDFTSSDKKIKKVLALPTSQMRAPGAKMLNERELGLVTRSFCSFYNEAGPFGHSWVFDLPELLISQSDKTQREYVTAGDQKVMVKTFRLIRPFGLQDISFVQNSFDPQYGRIAFLPERRTGIRALYPDDATGRYRVEYDDGLSDVFDTKGKLIERNLGPTTVQTYSYDAATRLIAVELKEGKEVIAKLTMSYDQEGRVVSAATTDGPIQYSYNGHGDLTRVTRGDSSVDYTYDDRHLVTRMTHNGTVLATFDYDELGRLKSGKKVATGKKAQKQTGANTMAQQNGGLNEISRKYDLAGKLTEAHLPSGLNIKAEYYYALGQPKSVVSKNRFGDTTQLEFSQDNRRVSFTDAEGNVMATIFDEFGRLKQLNNGSYALLEKNYGATDKGWLETTITSELTSQTLFNQDKKPTEHHLQDKQTDSQLITHFEYGSDGELQSQVTEGLVNAERLYQDGRLVKQSQDGEQTTYEYDADDRLNKVTSGDEALELNRANDGTLNKAILRKGKFEEIYEFAAGLLQKRTSGKGAVDSFLYDETGWLKQMNRLDGEAWTIERQDDALSVLRNGAVQMRFSFDEKGRLKEMMR